MRKVLLGLATLALVATPACKKDEKKNEPAPAKTPPDDSKPADKGGAGDDKPAEDDSKLVERGEYLTDLMGCKFCHTAMDDKGAPILDKAWAGGLEVPEKFGTWRSLNITQDEATGIGTWTDEQILAAIREGKRYNGDQLFMVMPYLFYNRLSDEDGKAIVAFLRTIKPIDNKVERASDLKLPEIPAPPPEGAAPPVDDALKYGEYLTGIMHCEMCHTPMSPEGKPDMSKRFAGGFEFEIPMMGEGILYSTNITSDKENGIGDWTDEEISASLKEMKKKDGSVIMGPMALYQSAWMNIADDDLKAISTYLRSIPANANKVPASTFKPHGAPPDGASGAPEAGTK